jgi:hypothetical protein
MHVKNVMMSVPLVKAAQITVLPVQIRIVLITKQAALRIPISFHPQVYVNTVVKDVQWLPMDHASIEEVNEGCKTCDLDK